MVEKEFQNLCEKAGIVMGSSKVFTQTGFGDKIHTSLDIHSEAMSTADPRKAEKRAKELKKKAET